MSTETIAKEGEEMAAETVTRIEDHLEKMNQENQEGDPDGSPDPGNPNARLIFTTKGMPTYRLGQEKIRLTLTAAATPALHDCLNIRSEEEVDALLDKGRAPGSFVVADLLVVANQASVGSFDFWFFDSAPVDARFPSRTARPQWSNKLRSRYGVNADMFVGVGQAGRMFSPGQEEAARNGDTSAIRFRLQLQPEGEYLEQVFPGITEWSRIRGAPDTPDMFWNYVSAKWTDPKNARRLDMPRAAHALLEIIEDSLDGSPRLEPIAHLRVKIPAPQRDIQKWETRKGGWGKTAKKGKKQSTIEAQLMENPTDTNGQVELLTLAIDAVNRMTAALREDGHTVQLLKPSQVTIGASVSTKMRLGPPAPSATPAASDEEDEGLGGAGES